MDDLPEDPVLFIDCSSGPGNVVCAACLYPTSLGVETCRRDETINCRISLNAGFRHGSTVHVCIRLRVMCGGGAGKPFPYIDAVLPGYARYTGEPYPPPRAWASALFQRTGQGPNIFSSSWRVRSRSTMRILERLAERLDVFIQRQY